MKVTIAAISGGDLVGEAQLRKTKAWATPKAASQAQYTKYPRKVTREWTHQMEFEARLERDGQDYRLDCKVVGKNAWLWRQLHEGARPHMIVPRRAKALRFRPKYSSRTKAPRSYGGSGKSSGKYVYARRVHHPGFKPRKFNEEWQRQAAKLLREQIQGILGL